MDPRHGPEISTEIAPVLNPTPTPKPFQTLRSELAWRQAEEEIGVPLFERLSTGLHLTAAGELLLKGVRTWRRDESRLRRSTNCAVSGGRALSGFSTRIDARVSAVDGAMLTLDTKYGQVHARASFGLGTSVVVGVRPELIGLVTPSTQSDAGTNALTMRLNDAVFQGSKRHLHFAADTPDQIIAEIHPASPGVPEIGKAACLSWRIDDTLVFPQ